MIDMKERVKNYMCTGIPISEMSYRQTGRTTRMIECIVEHINKLHEMKIKYNILLIGYNHSSSVMLLNEVYEKIKNYVLKRTKEIIKTKYVTLKIDSYHRIKEHEEYFRGNEFDDVYIDDACLDIERMRIRNLFCRDPLCKKEKKSFFNIIKDKLW